MFHFVVDGFFMMVIGVFFIYVVVFQILIM